MFHISEQGILANVLKLRSADEKFGCAAAGPPRPPELQIYMPSLKRCRFFHIVRLSVRPFVRTLDGDGRVRFGDFRRFFPRIEATFVRLDSGAGNASINARIGCHDADLIATLGYITTTASLI